MFADGGCRHILCHRLTRRNFSRSREMLDSQLGFELTPAELPRGQRNA
jgi:hypothetical protein